MDRQLLQNPQVVMDDLDEDVCWHLAEASSVARIGFVIDGEPWILPVNSMVLGRTIVFRTAEGSMLDTLGGGTPVVVEFDHVDEVKQTGWSVLARGIAEEVSRDALPVVGGSVHPWGPGEKDRWLWVVPKTISGRSISRPAPAPRFRLPFIPID